MFSGLTRSASSPLSDNVATSEVADATPLDDMATPPDSAYATAAEQQPSNPLGGKLSISRRPANPCPSSPVDYYREWARGNSVLNLVKHKLGASAEARRLKHQKAQEDERRALLLVRRMSGDDRDVYFDALGDSDPVYGKLRVTSSASTDDDMDELL